MTRARDELHLIVPQRFYVHQQHKPYGDKHVYASARRFIPRVMVPLFEDILWPPVTPAYIEGLSPAPAAWISAPRCAACGANSRPRIKTFRFRNGKRLDGMSTD
jgi:hypothetical protein